MPLIITTAAQTAAETLAELKALSRVYEHAAAHLDSIISRVIGLPNADLADFGNLIGQTDLDSLLTAHAQQVGNVNALATGCEAIIASVESREAGYVRTANTTGLFAQVEAQGRAIVLTAGVYSVVPLPEPEPEPDPEITP